MTAIEKNEASLKSESPRTDLLGVIQTLFRWKKFITIACLLVGIGSAVIVLLMPSYYQASTLFLAVSPDQATPELLFGETYSPQLYGDESDIDRVLTVAESNELVDYLVDSFQLYDHYKIEKGSARADNAVRKTFRGLFEVLKTKRDAIQLSVEDKDPVLAAQIASAAREKINVMGQALMKSTQGKAIVTFNQNIEEKEKQLKVLSDTLQNLRQKYGIYNSEAQSESLTSQLASTETKLVNSRARLNAYKEKGRRFQDSVSVYEVRVSGLDEALVELNQKMSLFNEGLSGVLLYTRQYQEANTSLSENKEKLKQYQAIYNSTISSILLVEEASVPLIKSRPFRTLIVLASVLIVFIFSVIGILLFEAYNDLDWSSIYHGTSK